MIPILVDTGKIIVPSRSFLFFSFSEDYDCSTSLVIMPGMDMLRCSGLLPWFGFGSLHVKLRQSNTWPIERIYHIICIDHEIIRGFVFLSVRLLARNGVQVLFIYSFYIWLSLKCFFKTSRPLFADKPCSLNMDML